MIRSRVDSPERPSLPAPAPPDLRLRFRRFQMPAAAVECLGDIVSPAVGQSRRGGPGLTPGHGGRRTIIQGGRRHVEPEADRRDGQDHGKNPRKSPAPMSASASDGVSAAGVQPQGIRRALVQGRVGGL